MKHRLGTSEQKSQIVLEGLSGQVDISALCQKYQISQTQYYKWRDLFLANCHESFEVKKQTKKEQHPEAQVKKLRALIGDLTIELKKRIRAMKRRRSQSIVKRDEELLSRVLPIKTDHPLWRYRRI